MAEHYNKTPSEILGIEDIYTAYCLNEACLFINSRLKLGEQPSFIEHYSKFSDLYKKFK